MPIWSICGQAILDHLNPAAHQKARVKRESAHYLWQKASLAGDRVSACRARRRQARREKMTPLQSGVTSFYCRLSPDVREA